ncbi:dihydrofolate reductase [soil metagenome]
MIVSLIVAASSNNAIGKDGQLLWSLPNDMKFFKNTTWGMTVIMGRKTYESVDKPLPGRVNIVITRQENWVRENVLVVKDLTEALEEAKETNSREVFIIGGGEIYRESMNIADRIYITRVHAELEGDTFFPVIDEKAWELKQHTDFTTDEKHQFSYSFQVWEKKEM